MATGFVPNEMFKPFRHIVRRLRKTSPVPLVSFGKAFPDVERLYQIGQEVIPTPEAVSMLFKDVVSILRGPSFSSTPAWSAALEGVLYCPTNKVVLTLDRQIVAESLFPTVAGIPPCRVYQPFDRRALKVERVEQIPGWSTSVFGHRRNYFHTLLDNLPRLFLLHHQAYAEIEKIQLLVTNRLTDQEEFFLRRMCPPNVECLYIEEGRFYETERFIFPSFIVQEAAAFLPQPYFDWFRRIALPERASRRDRKLFISRAQAERRRIKNDGAVHALLERYGYEICMLEAMSLGDQIQTFHDAVAVVGVHGAGWTNLIFAPENTPVVELFASRRVVPHYYYLSKTLRSPYAYLTHDGKDIHDDFEVDVQELEKRLVEVEGMLEV